MADKTEIVLAGDIDELIVELEAQFGADMELSSSLDPDTQTHGCTYQCTVTSGCATN